MAIEHAAARPVDHAATAPGSIRRVAVARGVAAANRVAVLELRMRRTGEWKPGSLSFTGLAR